MTAQPGRTDYLNYDAPLGWAFPAVIFSIMFVAGVAASVASVATGGPWPFYVVFLFVVGGGAYGFLLRRAYVVRIADGVLSWEGCRYHGSRRMSEVVSVSRDARGMYIWTFADGSRMVMFAFSNPRRLQREVAAFLDGVGVAYPDVSLPGYPGSR
ncbi:MAG: hypothetical protein ABI352_07815 [Candidatus Dormibacter sp.]